jgi:GAF domain-containing protein
MLTRLRKLFQPPIFEDLDKTRRAQNLNTILISMFVAVLLWVWYPIFIQGGVQIVIALSILFLLFGLYLILKRGHITLVGRLLTLLLWMAVIGTMTVFGGIRNSGFASIAIVIVIASLTLGARAGLLYVVMTIFAGAILVVAENRGMLPAYAIEPNTTIFVSYSLTILGIGLLLSLTLININKALQISLVAETSARDANAALDQSFRELEQRSLSLEKQNSSLQIVSEMAKLANEVKTENELLERTVSRLVEKLNTDHVGIFLVDNLEQNVVLTTTNSLEGKNLLSNNYTLKIASNPFALSTLESDVIKFQRRDNALFVSRPDSLPESKSNISVLITTGNIFLGVMNLQSYSPDPWLADEETLKTIADQIALSLVNLRLQEQLQKQNLEINHLAGEKTQTAWKHISSGETLGYQYDHLHILPKIETFPEEIQTVLNNQKSASYLVDGDNPSSRLVAPIILRDQVIGAIGYEDSNPAHKWLPTEKTMLETIASRVSLALENSRLVAEAEQRAEREKVVGQISSHIRETLDVETILRTTLQELHSSFELHEAEIRLQTNVAKSETP